MKKGLLTAGIIAALSVLIALGAHLGSNVRATDTHQAHCICGGNSVAATAANGHECATVNQWEPVTSFAELQAKIANYEVPTDVYVYLANDITDATGPITMGKNMQLHLCLNGKTYTAAKNFRAFQVMEPSGGTGWNASMTLCDCSSGRTGEIKANDETTASPYQGGNILVCRESAFTLFGGTISGGKPTTNGGNISVDPYNNGSDAVFKMYGGTIKDGAPGSYGGNVRVGNGCYFYLYGGTIENGTVSSATGGGNVYLDSGATMVMSGGTITGGTTTGSNGGGNIRVPSGATFTMTGGTISNGTCSGTTSGGGGNVSIDGGATFTMTGGTISGGSTGSSSSGGGNLRIAAATTNITGGTITGGLSYCYGGSILISGGTHTLSGLTIDGGRVNEDTAAQGGNIIVSNTAAVTLQNCTITNGYLRADGTKMTRGGNIAVNNSASLTLVNTTLSGGHAMAGGNLSLQGGTCSVTMTSGTITNGTATQRGSSGGFGGNVDLTGEKCTFTLQSGTISGGYANGNAGGNISIIGSNAVLTINGGTISGGRNNSANSGGIAAFYQATSAVININGGSIINNQGGIYATMGTVNLSGNPIIKDNGTNFATSGTATTVVTGPLTGTGNIEVEYQVGQEFAASSADYSAAFKTPASRNVVYDSAAQTHKIVYDGDYIDIANPTEDQKQNLKIDVYIIAGQSNAAGSTELGTIEYENRDFNVYENVHYYTTRINLDGTQMSNPITDYRPVQEGQGYNPSHIGPELGMAQALNPLYDSTERQAIIFKYAAGGTAVTAYELDDGSWADDHHPSNTDKYGTWYPSSLESETSKARGDFRATNFLTRGFKSAVTEFYNDLLSKGYQAENINFISMAWLQGESDRNRPEQYRTMFPILLDELRTHISETTGNPADATLPLVMNEISSTFSGAAASNVTANSTFIDMQRSLADTITNYVTIPTSEFALAKWENGASVNVSPDTWHYIYADIVEIGHLVVDATMNPEDYEHEHCECGTNTNVGDHTAHTDHKYRAVTNASVFSTLVSTANSSVTDLYLYLREDIELSARVSVGQNLHLHLCLNGHKLSVVGSLAVFNMNGGATNGRNEVITICDCSGTPGSIEADRTNANPNVFNGGVVYIGKGCGVVLYGGNIIGRYIPNSSEPKSYRGSGGTIALGAGGTAYFKMYGGTVSGGSAALKGGNVFVENGNFTMWGGTISGVSGESNRLACQGGNVYVMAGSFTMNGGVIENGNTTKDGGNVYIGGGTFIMNGGTITGGNVHVNGTTNSNGGNVFVGSTFTMNGGTITDGYAEGAGGNVYVATSATFNMTDGEVVRGGSNVGNGYCVCAAGTFNLSGGLLNTRLGGHSGRFIIAMGAASGRVNISGGQVLQNIQTTYANSQTTMTGGYVQGFSGHNGNLTISGGVVASAPTYGGSIALTQTTRNKLIIDGGYIGGKPTKTGDTPGEIILRGGFYAANPTEEFADTDYRVFTVNETYEGKTYGYEIAKGYSIGTASRLSSAPGEISAITGSLSGGGLYRENENFTLRTYSTNGTAVTGYQFLGWYDENDLTTPVTTASVFTAAVTAPANYVALYYVPAAGSVNRTISVNASSYEYAIGSGAAQSGTATFTAPTGSLVTIRFLGTEFTGWLNGSNKYVSKEAEYTFTVNADASFAAGEGGTSANPIVMFYSMYSQLLKAIALEDLTDADLAIDRLPAITGYVKEGWKLGSTLVSTKAGVEALLNNRTSVNLMASYTADPGALYTVTVIGKEEGTGAFSAWTAYPAGDGTYTTNKGAAVVLPELATDKTFLYYADADGNVLSTSAETYIRFAADTTIYAVYGTAPTEDVPRITMITNRRDESTNTTVYFEALRDVPQGYTLLEQGIVFTAASKMGAGTNPEDALSITDTSKCYKFVSSGKLAHDVTGLVIKNVSETVYAKGYLVYSDGISEVVLYTDLATVAY